MIKINLSTNTDIQTMKIDIVVGMNTQKHIIINMRITMTITV